MGILTDNLKVSFQTLEQNLTARGRSRYLKQFDRSSVMQQIVVALCQETQELYNEILNTLSGRTIEEAEGVQLDRIGYLVGQSRIVASSKRTDYFTPFLEEQGEDKFAVDVAKVWSKNGRLFEDGILEDDLYRKLILGKIYKNHNKGASLPNVRLAGSYIYGHLITLIKTGLQSFQIGFLSTSSVDGESSVDEDSLDAIYLLRANWQNTQVDNFYALPVPSTVYIDTVNIFIFPKEPEHDQQKERPNAFIPDTQNGIVGCAGHDEDFPKLAIKINIGEIL